MGLIDRNIRNFSKPAVRPSGEQSVRPIGGPMGKPMVSPTGGPRDAHGVMRRERMDVDQHPARGQANPNFKPPPRPTRPPVVQAAPAAVVTRPTPAVPVTPAPVTAAPVAPVAPPAPQLQYPRLAPGVGIINGRM